MKEEAEFWVPIDSPVGLSLTMDPWIVTPVERARHIEQFKALGPAVGFITGDQARGFLLQSGLPPPILAQIW